MGGWYVVFAIQKCHRMELGQTSRPRAQLAPYSDLQPRKKCSVCCALRCACATSGVVLLITLPCNLVMLRGRLCDARGVRGFVDRHFFLPLPVFFVTLTHQYLLSEGLWSKNKKTVWQVNWQSCLSNVTLWTVATVLCTVASRKCLVPYSRSYRLLMWDYHRARRACANRFFPTVFGRLTEDLDWYNVLWVLSIYHVLWGMVTMMLEKELGAHYAIFYRDSEYSKWCSPRWREWRELEAIRKSVDTEQRVPVGRWGSFITSERWRVSGVRSD